MALSGRRDILDIPLNPLNVRDIAARPLIGLDVHFAPIAIFGYGSGVGSVQASRHNDIFMLTQSLTRSSALGVTHSLRADRRPLWRRLASFARRNLRALADRVPG